MILCMEISAERLHFGAWFKGKHYCFFISFTPNQRKNTVQLSNYIIINCQILIKRHKQMQSNKHTFLVEMNGQNNLAEREIF